MKRWLGISSGVLLALVTATTAFAWENAPPVVDCAGVTHPALSYATEAAYNAAVVAQQATTCPTTSPSSTSPPNTTPRHLVAVCHNEDGPTGQMVVQRNVAPDQVPKYLNSPSGLDFLMSPGGDCGPTVP